MSDYDWKKEREKFHTNLTSAASQKTENANGNFSTADTAGKEIAGKGGLRLVIAVFLVLLAVGTWIFVSHNSNNSTAAFVKVAEQKKKALGLVVLVIETKDHQKKVSLPCGTAWAFSDKQFATNGHVAAGIQETLADFIANSANELLAQEAKKNNCQSVDDYLKKLGEQKAEETVKSATQFVISKISSVQAEIIINGTKKQSYTVTHVQIHKGYGAVDTKFDPDVAVLTIKEKHDCYFSIADQKTLGNLKSGIPVAFLGFPTEGLRQDNVNIDNPIASMQTGIIVAVSDFEMKDAGQSGNFLIRHSLPATGGASGSPIFNQKGEVLALLYAGNVIGQINADGKVQRAPSAAMINFGVRVDLISGMAAPVAIEKFLSL